MPMTADTSRSAAFTAMPSSSTRHASFTTGKNIISTISLSDNFVNWTQLPYHKLIEEMHYENHSQKLWKEMRL